MLATKIDIWNMKVAMARINERKYHGNIDFRFLEYKNGRLHFRLVARTYDFFGYRLTHAGFLHPSACWHAHGDFFDSVFEVEPKAKIYSAGGREGLIKITKDEGNWQNRNIGSDMVPLMFSNACACGIFENMKQYLGREMRSWKDFTLSIKELSQDAVEELLYNKMENWPHILIRNCSPEVFQSGIFDGVTGGFGRHDCTDLIEQRTVKLCPKTELPLLMGTLTTGKGKAALDRRLKRC